MRTARRLLGQWMLLAALLPSLADGQKALWSPANAMEQKDLPTPQLTAAQKAAVRSLLLAHQKQDRWCAGEDASWTENLQYSYLPLGGAQPTLLVQAGEGCGRGGQGANGEMWLVMWNSPRPRLIASPADGFNGWISHVARSSSHGLHDIVVGWHMSAFEFPVTLLRYNGTVYRPVSSATLRSDGGEDERVTDIKPIKSSPTTGVR